jgi:hypothetical protein
LAKGVFPNEKLIAKKKAEMKAKKKAHMKAKMKAEKKAKKKAHHVKRLFTDNDLKAGCNLLSIRQRRT